MSKRILVPLAEGFEEIEAITIIDILRRANLEVITSSLTDNLEVKGGHNITVKADTILVVNDKLANDPFMLSVYQLTKILTQYLLQEVWEA